MISFTREYILLVLCIRDGYLLKILQRHEQQTKAMRKLVLKKGCVISETYRSGIQLLGWFVDHTVERRGGRALPLYHPHKDRKRERRYLKGIPHNT